MLRNAAAIAVFAAFAFTLSAQTHPPKPCDTVPLVTDDGKIHDTASKIKEELAKEWLAPKAVAQALKAFDLLSSFNPEDGSLPNPAKAASDALAALSSGTPASASLYKDALGSSDLAGLSAFLDLLAGATTIEAQREAQKGCLADLADTLLDDIVVKAADGRHKLRKIQDAFTAKDLHRALYLLLSAYPCDEKASDADKTLYVYNLEVLRTVYGLQADVLPKLVAKKNSGGKS